MPGCYMLQSSEVLGMATSVVAPGTSLFSLTLPTSPLLVGQHAYFQAYTYAPGANALEVLASNGLDWLIGNQ